MFHFILRQNDLVSFHSMSVQLHVVLVICIAVSGSREESESPVRVRGGNLSGAEGTSRYVTWLAWLGSLRYAPNKSVLCYMIGLKKSSYCLKWFACVTK